MEFGMMADINLYVTLQIDEMHVTSAAEYDPTHDQIIGLAENESSKKGKKKKTVGKFTNKGQRKDGNQEKAAGRKTMDDGSDVQEPAPEPITTPTGEVVLANKLLCFYLKGLSKRFKLPVSFHFVNSLTADQLYDLTMQVLKDVEDIGFRVARIATDNAKTNVKLFDKLNKGTGAFAIPHPLDPTRTLFLSYDYTHLIKN